MHKNDLFSASGSYLEIVIRGLDDFESDGITFREKILPSDKEKSYDLAGIDPTTSGSTSQSPTVWRH